MNNTLENYLWFFGIILLSIVFKRFISNKVSGLILKLFKRFISSKNEVSTLLNLLVKPIESLILVVAVYIAFNTLDYSGITEDTVRFKSITNLIFNLVIVIIFTWIVLKVIDFLVLILEKQAEATESKVDDQIILFAKEAARLTVYIISFLIILGAVFNINIGSLIAGLGIGGLAIALAAQDTLENLIASFIIFFDKPFHIGELITAGGVTGVVEKIGFRSTRIRTLEKSFVTVPNKMLISSELDNLSLRTFRRAKFDIGLTYGTSEATIKNIVKEIQDYIDKHEKTNQDGLVKFDSYGDFSLNVMVLFYVETQEWVEYLNVKQDIMYKIMDVVNTNDSDFAFPTQSLLVTNENN